jgi:hypothetical protein
MKTVSEASKRDFYPQMPLFAAVGVNFARFVASGAAGRAAAGKALKRGLKWYLLGPGGQKKTYVRWGEANRS